MATESGLRTAVTNAGTSSRPPSSHRGERLAKRTLWDDDDDSSESIHHTVLQMIMGVRSWEQPLMWKLPTNALVFGLADLHAKHTFLDAGRNGRGLIIGDGLPDCDVEPWCWPCCAASKVASKSSTVLDKVGWHLVEDEAAECFAICEVGCKGTVCGLGKLLVGVIVAGPHASSSDGVPEMIANRLLSFGVHILVGIQAPTEVGGYKETDTPFDEHVEFLEGVLRLTHEGDMHEHTLEANMLCGCSVRARRGKAHGM